MHVVKVNKPADDVKEWEYLDFFGYKNPVAIGKGIYTVETLGSGIPTIEYLGNEIAYAREKEEISKDIVKKETFEVHLIEDEKSKEKPFSWEEKEVYVVTISLKNIDKDGEELNWVEPCQDYYADTLEKAEEMKEKFLSGKNDDYGDLVESCYVSEKKEKHEFLVAQEIDAFYSFDYNYYKENILVLSGYSRLEIAEVSEERAMELALRYLEENKETIISRKYVSELDPLLQECVYGCQNAKSGIYFIDKGELTKKELILLKEIYAAEKLEGVMKFETHGADVICYSGLIERFNFPPTQNKELDSKEQTQDIEPRL